MRDSIPLQEMCYKSFYPLRDSSEFFDIFVFILTNYKYSNMEFHMLAPRKHSAVYKRTHRAKGKIRPCISPPEIKLIGL